MRHQFRTLQVAALYNSNKALFSRYSWLPTGKSLFAEDTPTQKGIISNLIEDVIHGKFLPYNVPYTFMYTFIQRGDIGMSYFVPTLARYHLVDFTIPIFETPFSIVIPAPSRDVNNGALVQPFRYEVKPSSRV